MMTSELEGPSPLVSIMRGGVVTLRLPLMLVAGLFRFEEGWATGEQVAFDRDALELEAWPQQDKFESEALEKASASVELDDSSSRAAAKSVYDTDLDRARYGTGVSGHLSR